MADLAFTETSDELIGLKARTGLPLTIKEVKSIISHARVTSAGNPRLCDSTKTDSISMPKHA